MTRLRLLAVLALLAAVAAAPAQASDLEAQLGGVSARIDRVTDRISDANASRPSLVSDMVLARDRLSAQIAELEVTRQELARVEVDRAATQALLAQVRTELSATHLRLATTRAELKGARDAAGDWARELYMSAGQVSVGVTFGAAEMTEMLVGMEYLHAVAEEGDRALLRYESLQVQEERERDRIAAQESEVADGLASLVVIEAQLDELESEHARRADVLEGEVGALRSRLDELDAEIGTFEGELAGLQREQDRLEQLIADETSKEGTSPSVLVRPVPGPITSSFGPRLHPILGISLPHTGVDLQAAWGRPVAAGAGGRVILAGSYGGYGIAVIIDHGGGMSTLYAHLSSVAVSYGETVSGGDTVGLVGSTGASTGPHLHFEVRVDGKPVDPVPYL